ncbi:MAG: ketopantoate reductase family protein [Lachnospiraceae bacterium]|nr:ketopantoate reductase family protein [Lachnospiraceae bacterium]
MKVGILGLGVIGTTYAYAFQKAGHETYHIVREEKRTSMPAKISVHLLDGRYNTKGEEKDGEYNVSLVNEGDEFDFILISVASGKLVDAMKTIRNKCLKGTIILFCNFWNDRTEVDAIMGDADYITAFPTAGGHMQEYALNCVLFDHIMLEDEKKAGIPNYSDLISLLHSADIKQEIPNDMFEWIWIHMAINAGVTSTAARGGIIDDPNRLARELMSDSKALAIAVKSIRETIKTVEARGVNLRLYKNELMPYKIPSGIAGMAMKKLFSNNELTSRIMTLHNDINDIMYGCKCVYDEGKKHNLDLPLFYANMNRIFAKND